MSDRLFRIFEEHFDPLDLPKLIDDLAQESLIVMMDIPGYPVGNLEEGFSTDEYLYYSALLEWVCLKILEKKDEEKEKRTTIMESVLELGESLTRFLKENS